MSLTNEQLYSMMIAQLQEDGQFVAAANLASNLLLPLPRGQESSRSLRRSVEMALDYIRSDASPGGALPQGRGTGLQAADSAFQRFAGRSFQTLDSLHFRNAFQARHQHKASVVRFSPDGTMLVSGGCDCILKLIHVEEAKNAQARDFSKPLEHGQEPAHTRTLYGHFGRVNDVAFHPYASMLASSSQDCTIKFFPIVRTGSQQSVLESIPTSTEVTSLDWHTCGVVLAATTNAEHGIRLIDVNKPGQVTVRLTSDDRVPFRAGMPEGTPPAYPPPGAEAFTPYYSKCRFVQDSSLLAALSGTEISFYDARTGSRKPEIVLPAPNGLLCSGFHAFHNGIEFVASYRPVAEDARKKVGSRLYDIRSSMQKYLATYPAVESSPSSMAGDSVVIGITNTSHGTRPVGYLVNPSGASGGEAENKYLFGYDNIEQLTGRYSDHTYCISVGMAIHICDPQTDGRVIRKQSGR